MALNYLHFDDQKQHGRMLRRNLQQLEESTEGIADLLATMAHMVDGDGSEASHFTMVVTRFGFPDSATAKAAWDELQSLNSKFSGNDSVSQVNAAMQQAFAKFRG